MRLLRLGWLGIAQVYLLFAPVELPIFFIKPFRSDLLNEFSSKFWLALAISISDDILWLIAIY